MKLSDFEKEGGGYEYEGAYYEEVEDLLQVGIFGFCACGTAETNLYYILGGLELIADRGPDPFKDRPAWDAWYADYTAREKAHYGTEGARWFFKYWADKENLTEHGSNVSSAWLDEKGHQWLELLREWHALPESSDSGT